MNIPMLGGIMGKTITTGGSNLPPLVINVAADFPTTAIANDDIGRIYIAGANVTDNDETKTNTNQSFLAGQEFVWNGVSAYVVLGDEPRDQIKMYYVGDAGSSVFNGKSLERPFDDPQDAISAILALTPGPNNRFGIQFIGGFQYIGDIVVPRYTTIFGGQGSRIIGTVNMNAGYSMLKIDYLLKPDIGTLVIEKSSGGDPSFVEVYSEINTTTLDVIVNSSAGDLFVKTPRIYSLSDSATFGFVKNTGSGNTYLTADYVEGNSGGADGYVINPEAGNIYYNVKKTYCPTDRAFVYASATGTGNAYIEAQEIDAAAGKLSNLVSGFSGKVYLKAQKASGAVIGDASKLIATIKEGPTASTTVKYRDGNLDASGNVTAGGNISTTSGDVSTSSGTISGQSGLIRDVTGEATLDVYGGSNPLAWSTLHLYGDATFFRGAGVRISKDGGAGQWWAGVQYSAGGQYRIVYDTGTIPETGGIQAIQCLVNGEVRLPSIGTTASGTGYNDLYARTSDGLVKRFTSSIQYKENVQDMGDTSWLYQLRPVTFTPKEHVIANDECCEFKLMSKEPSIVEDNVIYVYKNADDWIVTGGHNDGSIIVTNIAAKEELSKESYYETSDDDQYVLNGEQKAILKNILKQDDGYIKHTNLEGKCKQYGLISEEVAVVNDTIGADDTVHYQQLISVLINEVQKLNDRITALEGI